MATVPTLLKERWASRRLVGDASHSCLVRIRQGFVDRLYQATEMLPTSPDPDPQTFPLIWHGDNASPWQGQWTPTGDWITLTNIQSANWTRSFQDQGSSTLTVVMDNIAFNAATGTGGVYHNIQRGWYSPTRGVKVVARPSLWAPNDWDDVFNGGYQIELWEGYGQGDDITPTIDDDSIWSAPSASKTFVGLIEDCDMESHPDHITLTCTDFAVMFTDQRVMGYNKAKEISSPITFADRRKVQGESKEFGGVVVSSGAVTSDSKLGAVWESEANDDDTAVEWIELHLPAGFYTDFYLALPYDGENMFIGLYAAAGSVMDRTTDLPADWVDLGLGVDPGDGHPIIAEHDNTVSDPSRRWSLGGHTFSLGDGSILRLTFNNLSNDIDQIPVTGRPTGDAYRAGTNSFYAFRYGSDPQHPAGGGTGVKAKHWILVEDAADVVRMIMLWAGFKEFRIENFGWTLEAPMSFGQDAFFIDIINAILAQGNYCFFMDAPTDHDLSIGVPVFRPQSATKSAPQGMLQIRDTDMAEALTQTWDLSNLPYVIRFRGAETPDGSTLFEDTTKRFMGTYWPPWSGHDYTQLQGMHFEGTYPLGRVAGVRRHFSQTDTSLTSVAECLFACILTAIQYALQAVTGSFQIAGLPGISLDNQVSLIDEGTGTNTRIWTASIDSQHTLGPNGTWHMTVGGAMVDTEDMNMLALDYFYTYQRYVVYKAGQ